MKYLIVAAHPDDEVLGAGGAIYKWTREGHIVDVCLMCTEARARAFRPEDKELNNNLNASSKFLGINKIYEGVFPNIVWGTERSGLNMNSEELHGKPLFIGVSEG